ncbi:uncharacterized protein [Branchiostoma lanceolatum]|uniref:uncharacterized protein n=1 Tax=Branchiostoma lanceolatum TaxID=7740 RepID=UPI003457285E
MKRKKYTPIIAFVNSQVHKAACSCPAGFYSYYRTCPGGLGKCNHIGGLLFAIEAFNKTDLKEQPTPVSCTSKSSTWNVPRNDKVSTHLGIAPLQVEAQPITGIRLGKIRYGKETKFLKTSHYDPRAPHQREVDVTALAILKRTIQADQPESMFHLYGEGCSGNPTPSDACRAESGDASGNPTPSDACRAESGDASGNPTPSDACRAESGDASGNPTPSDACRAESGDASGNLTPSDACRAESGDARPAPTDPSDHDSHLPDLPFNDHYDFSTRSFIHMMDTYIKTATLTKEEQINIEEETRGQSSSTAWKEKRKEKLTASNFKSAITCTVEPSNKINAMLYNSFSTAATEYGNRNEAAAVEEYVNLIQEEHPGAHCVETGLILSLERPWLGASVDGLVRQDGQTIGGLEVKCPSSKQGMSVQEASQDSKFFLKQVDSCVTLKKSHKYYDQVQGTVVILYGSILWFTSDQVTSFVSEFLLTWSGSRETSQSSIISLRLLCSQSC